MIQDFESFKNREAKAKSIFDIEEITKPEAYEFVRRYHYLGDAKFFCVQAFGLFHKESHELVGVATYSLPQGNVALKGWFNCMNDTKDIYELSRLCMLPILNGTNATSFLLGGSIKLLKKQGFVRAVITLADSSRHVGSIYQVCNFKYYGLTDFKNDFFTNVNGKMRVNPRGAVKTSRECGFRERESTAMPSSSIPRSSVTTRRKRDPHCQTPPSSSAVEVLTRSTTSASVSGGRVRDAMDA